MKHLLITLTLFFGFFNSIQAQDIFINEVNYASTILAERGIGIAGPAGTDLSGWGITIYNNSGGVETTTNITSGIIPNQQSDRGEFFVDVGVNLTENQGAVLIDEAGQVVQFVNFGSLTGVITATTGIANGLTSNYIGFHGNTQSLQLSGTGCEASDFVWAAQSPTTPGNINTSQTFDGCSIGLLPIDWIAFDGVAMRDGIRLTWSTANEINNEKIIIERSVDGSSFEAIGSLAGQGSKESMTQYEYVDTEILTPIHYYRLQQVDYDGVFTHSNVIVVKTNELQLATKAYPNPFVAQTTLSFETPQTGHVDIVDARGQHINTLTFDNQMKIAIDGSSYPPGVYYLKLVTQSTSSITTIIKN